MSYFDTSSLLILNTVGRM